MKTPPGRRALLVLGTIVAGFMARPASAHPLHTSVATITQNGSEDFTVSLRVFADDFLRHTGVPEATAAEISPDARIVALDAQSGKPCEDFGARGHQPKLSVDVRWATH